MKQTLSGVTSGIKPERGRVYTMGAICKKVRQYQISACVVHGTRHQKNSNQTYLGSNFLNNGIVHLSPDNGAVCLHDDVILLAIFHNVFLLAERMQLRKNYQRIDAWSVPN